MTARSNVDLGLTACVLLVLLFFWKAVLLPGEPASSPIRLVGHPARAPAVPNDLPTLEAPSLTVHLGFVGDIMQHRAQGEDNYIASYARIARVVGQYDLTMGNLEFPVDTTKPVGPLSGSIRFNGSPRHVEALARAGFDLLSVANNHAFDQGVAGAERTTRLLYDRGVTPVGAASNSGQGKSEPVVKDIRGLRIAFQAYTIPPNAYPDSKGEIHWPARDSPIAALNFDDWTLEYREYGRTVFREDVAKARQSGARFLVAFVHWGREWYLQPTEDQRLVAHDLVEAGYDLVVGSHGHVLNGPEIVEGKLVAYSLGNFISDFRTLETRTGTILDVTVGVDSASGMVGVTNFAYLPTLVRPIGHVVTLVDSSATSEQARAWTWARRMLGSALLRPPVSWTSGI